MHVMGNEAIKLVKQVILFSNIIILKLKCACVAKRFSDDSCPHDFIVTSL